MILKRFLSFISVILLFAYVPQTVTPALAALIPDEDTVTVQTAADEDYTIPEFITNTENDNSDTKPIFENGVIKIYNYAQLCLIGSGAELTSLDFDNENIGQGDSVLDGESTVAYALDCRYEIAQDVVMPRHTVWMLPSGFTGSIYGEVQTDPKLYDPSGDTVYIYNPYQLAVMMMDNADQQPVLSGDNNAQTFGTGQPVLTDENSDDILTYSSEHNYVISSQFNSEITEESLSVRKKSIAKSADAGDAEFEGRDFAGQVLKKINGKTYILIGNQQQLRAIGSDQDVFSAVYQTHYSTINGHVLDVDSDGRIIQLYGGDADLHQSQNGYRDYNFHSINDVTHSGRFYVGVNQETGQPYTDATHATINKNSLTEASWRTGEKYSIDANYIVFRDIDLEGQSNPWTPLMFRGIMYGSKSVGGEKLWNGSTIGNATELTALAEQNSPVISNVYVNQNSTLNVNEYIGIGFFATITNQANTANIGISGDTAVVNNICLNNVHVENNTNQAGINQTLLNAVTQNLGRVLGTLVDVVLLILSFGSANTDLGTTLSNLLNARAQDPTIYATGAFAGRVYGNAVVENCRVTGVVEVSNINDRTGGFVGYTEGMTEYRGLSRVLGTAVQALATILNAVPGVGLGDLITILLGNALPLDSLIPTNYIAPEIVNCEVQGLTGDVGSTTKSFNGGFVGQQIGTRIENCSITNSTYWVKAKNYGGGFCGLERDAEIKGTLDGVGIDLSSIINNIHPQSVLIDCEILNCNYNVTGESFLGGFIGAMTSSYAVDCTIDCDNYPLTVNSSGNYAGGFAGYSSVGWQSSLGKEENNENSLLGTVRQLVTGLLSTDKAAGQKLLTLMGVSPSAIIGCRIYSEELSVQAGDSLHEGSYAGGIVGKGDGIYLGKSDQAAYDTLANWNSGTLRETPGNRTVILSGLEDVTSTKNYAGGIAGYMGSAAFQGLLNDVVGLGDFIGFNAIDIIVTGIQGGYTVNADQLDAGGGFGYAVGGKITNVELRELNSVTAYNRSGGFAAVAGPGELAGTNGLTVNLLGLDRVLEVSNLLKIGQGIEVKITDCSVEGIESGFTVEATGTPTNENDVTSFKASGFAADSNSTRIVNSHVYRLLSVTSSDVNGYAGGFVGTSATGGLGEAANGDVASVKSLIQADGLISAIQYLIPTYTDCTVNYTDGGYVDADVAGGFAGDMESGTVDNSVTRVNLTDMSEDDMTEGDYTHIDITPWTRHMTQVFDPDTVNSQGDLDKQFAVFNIDRVYGRTYGGGFGGKIRSGALAKAGGGISILGDSELGLNIGIDNLVGIMNAYIPVVKNAGVYSENGFTVAANEIRSDDPYSGSAGGFAGCMSGAQISNSNVYKLKHTAVTPPDDLEAVNAPSYFDSSQSVYAVIGGHYAGGFAGSIDIGDAASVSNGLKVLGRTIQLTNVVSALSVVVTTIEHSDVQGCAGGFSVIADATDPDDGKVGMAGGFAGGLYGGHIQNSHCINFYYIIGQEAAGGYVGNMEPGNVANLLDDASILSSLVDIDSSLASLVEDFIPTIRNSTTSCVPCGGAVRAHSPSDAAHQRGCAGGYCGHNEGGHIWGFNTNTWKDQNDGQVGNHNYGHNTEGNYTGEQHRASAWRIRSVYGYEYAGGFTGYMESADTAETGSIKLLGGLLSLDNILTALSVVYPTEEHTAVYGPLRNLDWQTWNAWVTYVGVNGPYGGELVREGTVSNQTELDSVVSKYIYGYNVAAGRDIHEQTLITEGGNAGGYVGYMVSGVITDGQAYDAKLVRAFRSAGGYAGKMQTGGAASFGTFSLLGLQVNLGNLVKAVQVFVPAVKSCSVQGYQSGLTVICTGTDFVHNCGYAGGYVGSAYGAQIFGDENVGQTTGTGCNVSNLRYVRGLNAAGGYVGLATAASVADVNTNSSEGLLQNVLNSLITSPGNLASVLQATVTTARNVSVSPDDNSFGFIVEGLNGTPPRYAGGFAGSLEATVINKRKGGTTAAVNGLRSVDGKYYAGGFVGLADVGSVASVSGTGDETTTILALINAGSVDVLDVFRTYIYDSAVNGVSDGFFVQAHNADSEGLLSEIRYTGCAGGFAGGMMNGTIKRSEVNNLNTVKGLNYTGGFIGHAGKNGAVDIDDAAISSLVGLTAGVLDIFGTVIDSCGVTGTGDGIVISSKNGEEPIAGGFAGYADVSQIKNSDITELKQVYSDEIAGGFVGKTDMHYLIELEASSPLVQLVLKILNVLVKLLYVVDLENLGLINLDADLLGLKVLSDGDLLYVNLLGLKIGVSLVRSTEPGVTDTALITIGDSSVALPCTDQGIDMNNQNAEIAVNLIKGNRTKAESCTVKGLDCGYDVFGGGSGNTRGSNDPSGYAGGFVGYNNEGKFTDNVMEYCDVIRGTEGKIGPFSGMTSLMSVYSFNTLASIEAVEGHYNKYSVYRGAAEYDQMQYALTENNLQIGSAAVQDTGTAVTYNRYDVYHLLSPLQPTGDNYYSSFQKWEDAVASNTQNGSGDKILIGVYCDEPEKDEADSPSGVKVVLMSNIVTLPNDPSGTVNDGETQDPCEDITLTIHKIWDDWNDFDGIRPDEIEVRLIRYMVDTADNPISDEFGETITEIYSDTSVISDADAQGYFTLTKADNSLAGTAVWERIITGLPSQTHTANGETVYYRYTAEEKNVYGYTQNIDSSFDGYTINITNTHRPALPVTGGFGDWLFVIFGSGIVLFALIPSGRRKKNKKNFRPQRFFNREKTLNSRKLQ